MRFLQSEIAPENNLPSEKKFAHGLARRDKLFAIS
jgi:hypothetical protein